MCLLVFIVWGLLALSFLIGISAFAGFLYGRGFLPKYKISITGGCSPNRLIHYQSCPRCGAERGMLCPSIQKLSDKIKDDVKVDKLLRPKKYQACCCGRCENAEEYHHYACDCGDCYEISEYSMDKMKRGHIPYHILDFYYCRKGKYKEWRDYDNEQRRN